MEITMDFKKLLDCELFLFDMDGTLYLGDEIYDGAIELMEDLPRLGKKYIYLTNNSSRAGEDYITRLKKLGFPCEAENVFTSGMATGLFLRRTRPEARVYLVGTAAFRRELLSYGVNLVEQDADTVVVGFDTELVYEKLDKACHFLRRGAAFIAANPDWVCPMPADEVLPDCGSICALLTASEVSAMTGIDNSRICAVGDRLYTDIAVAQNAGAVSLLVMSGETDETILAAAERKPDYVLPSVKELHLALKGELKL